MNHIKDTMKVSKLANDISHLALQHAQQSDCSPQQLIRAMAAATVGVTTSLSVPEHRLMALITLSTAFMDDLHKIAKAVSEGAIEDDDDDEIRPN